MNTHTLITPSTQKQVLSPNNLGLIRYLFALTIILVHMRELAGISIDWPIASTDGVKGFFIISGFLVGLSYMRSNGFNDYFLRRLKRLMPGYFGVITFCILTGCVFSTLPLPEFISNSHTWRYIIANLTTLNFLGPTLPGVFEHNSIPALNGSLWTTKVELMLYLMIPPVIIACRKYNKNYALIAIFLFSAGYSEICTYLFENTQNQAYNILSRQGLGQIRYFFAGTLFLFNFTQFTRYAKFIVPASLLTILFVPDSLLYRTIEPFCLTALIIGAAYLLPYCPWLQRKDNIAYGIYLFHFPVIQILVDCEIFRQSPLSGIILTLTLTCLLAIISWNLIEKRFLIPTAPKEKRQPVFGSE